MSTDQEYWDACLISTWRKAGSVWDVMVMFTGITGKKVDEVEPPLLRTPRSGFPWRCGVRVFVAAHLSKISKRLWEQPPEKDVALLRKLQESTYDTEKDGKPDNSLNSQRGQIERHKVKIEYSSRVVAGRNHATDWNVTKGKRR